jgi:hypothetical protein
MKTLTDQQFDKSHWLLVLRVYDSPVSLLLDLRPVHVGLVLLTEEVVLGIGWVPFSLGGCVVRLLDHLLVVVSVLVVLVDLR